MSGIIKLSLTILIICTLLIIYYIEADREYILPSREYLVKGHFLVDSDECKIINLHPFNDESMKFYNPVDYIPCRELDLLTYVTKERNVAELHINQTLIPLYSEYEVKCCYSYVTRNPEKGDNGLEMSECEYFSDKVQLDGDIVTVKCQDSFSMLIYENTHSPVMITEEIQTKLNNKKESAISLTLIGIDSISRLNFIRVMPKTFNFVETNDFYSLKGYNKIGDNTYPNVMALLTGMTEKQAEQQCNSSKSGKLDSCPMLWYDFRNFGHITAYAEDDPTIGTFNYGRKGFSHSPTDYYFRTYMLASERLRTKQIDFLTYCVGPESSGEKIMNIVKDFEYTFKNAPTFGFYWMNTFSHNNLNMPSSVDDNITNFLQDLQQSGHFNKSIVVFLSDHGMRFGSIRNTHTGWMEERLPYIYFSFPPTFKEKFPVEYNNFLSNEYKLTSPFDLYMTLQHLLVLSGYNYTMKPSIGCHKSTTTLYS
ncbi:uncharacterized protein LOC109595943 isoform X2 [Aethina tumida]|uniref:uncharacterized protein LOC109595943 isoform X2 n=1 Tax=Aethina tumida TaxID=116153 RepID=UPI002148CEA1|nr:uncharacterized protein LOC109595943 isoform X2 [Aethina tumida]